MKRILVATDLGIASATAVERAMRLAAEDGADIRIVHVAPDGEDLRRSEAIHRRLIAETGAAAQEITLLPLRISVRVLTDDAAESILGEADKFNPDLIVLGGHAEPRLRDAMFGTTATYVVRHSVRPVLIVQNDPKVPYSKVVVAVDEPQSVPVVSSLIADIASSAQIFAVHAHYPTLGETLGGQAAIDRGEARLTREIEAVFAADGGTGAHVSVEMGDPLSTIMDEAEKIEPDLLAMGTHRRATFLSSNAVDAVFWWTGDLLVVPEREMIRHK